VSPVVVAVAVVGALLGPVLRGQILRHAVPAGEPWRDNCPHCTAMLLRPGRRGLPAALPSTGRCPRCGRRIGPPPGSVEVLAATLLALLAWRVADPLTLAAFTWLAALGVILGFVDTAVHRLPDRLTLAAFTGTLLPLGAAALLGGRPGRLGIALLCALAVGAFYLLLVLISPAGMGLGDAKAAFSVGLAAGWLGWGAAFLTGALAAILLTHA
jgi:leader peptidase (prepilin peptidase)/N-methyltransferase